VEAFEEAQQYKEGKFILEKAMIAKQEEQPSDTFVECPHGQ
jgi:hypothetical protein